MNPTELVEQIVADLGPDKLREMILHLSGVRAADDRAGVPLPAILDALTGPGGLGEGPDAWRAQLRLQGAIRETVGQIPGMRYIEGDS